jgi:hypothetical protein
MNTSEKLLKSIIGDQGYEVLEKAIFKRGTSSVVDPLEFYLPLIVVPRTILSWLIQTIKPMKRGESKVVKFPGKDDIVIQFDKQDIDQYRAEFVQNGKVIHSFEKQSLPAVSGHMMTVGETYDFFEEKIDEVKSKISSDSTTPDLSVIKEIINLNEIKPSLDSESVKWQMSHANIKELTSVIGKLVDALMTKEMGRKKIEEDLDKISEKEVADVENKLETSITPEEKFKKELKAKQTDSNITEESISYKELAEIKNKPTDEQKVPKEKVIDTKQGEIKKQVLPEAQVEAPMTSLEGVSPSHTAPAPKTPMTKADSYFKKKAELLMKPYASEAQRRWAHTKTGTKALGGKEKVKEWDRESKGKDLPEKVSKAEMPKGAGQPVKPSMPKEPKPPVPASNNPAASAAKQAQSSAKGNYTPPKTPGAKMPKNPTAKPKATAAPKPAGSVIKSDYFKSKLNKSEKYTTTEEELYKSHCPHCLVPEFKKDKDGNPAFNPCACFSVMKKDEEGNPYKFVEVIKKTENGVWDLKFHPNADEDAVKVFLLTLKAHLLVKRKFDI